MRLNGFDLNQLLCLEALLTERNVTRAAQRVHLSQSAMSTTLGHLREHFDDELLVRSGRSLVLTPFARTLIAPLSGLMSQARSFASLTPDQDVSNIDRELKIVASDYTMATILAEAIKRAGQQMPNLRFDILPLTSFSPSLLEAGEIDLLIAGQALDVGREPNEHLFDDDFSCLVCRTENGRLKTLSRSDYIERRHVVVRYFEHQMAFEDEDVLRISGVQRKRHITVWSYSLVPQLICGTTMVATIPSRIAHRLAERWPVVPTPFPFDHQPVRVFGYWHSSREKDAVLRSFLSTVRAIASQ
ncbi:MAG: LysR family transcriptional regulator [Pseudomonadota bacterium]